MPPTVHAFTTEKTSCAFLVFRCVLKNTLTCCTLKVGVPLWLCLVSAHVLAQSAAKGLRGQCLPKRADVVFLASDRQ